MLARTADTALKLRARLTTIHIGSKARHREAERAEPASKFRSGPRLGRGGACSIGAKIAPHPLLLS
jgi:hypothetical protein